MDDFEPPHDFFFVVVACDVSVFQTTQCPSGLTSDCEGMATM